MAASKTLKPCRLEYESLPVYRQKVGGFLLRGHVDMQFGCDVHRVRTEILSAIVDISHILVLGIFSDCADVPMPKLQKRYCAQHNGQSFGRGEARVPEQVFFL
ncbi:MAG: hypothetical protein ACT6Q7_00260 [Blastomonas fulva]|uniref:hypothetical protein n=1 Tax=Blastomonas fulva TaxID=1550728 RepID=UPI0040348572